MNLRHNNFDLLRLAFAAAVMLAHHHVLTGEAALEVLQRVFSTKLAVDGFFIISGHLVVMSCDRSGLREYWSKRIRRIYPAYLTVVIACALAGAWFSSLPHAAYFSSAQLWSYLAANLAFLNFLAPNLPGVFTTHLWTEVNGALWTLKIEVMFYALVPLLLLLVKRLGAAVVLATLYALSLAWFYAFALLHESSGANLWLQLQRQLPGQLTYFLVGAGFYLYRERLNWPLLAAVGIAAYLLASPAWQPVLEPIWLGIAVVAVAYKLPHLGNLSRYGDLSYGVYIIHVPVIQAATSLGLYEANPWSAFAATSATIVALAFLCWHLVERPFLFRQSHYRAASVTQ